MISSFQPSGLNLELYSFDLKTLIKAASYNLAICLRSLISTKSVILKPPMVFPKKYFLERWGSSDSSRRLILEHLHFF